MLNIKLPQGQLRSNGERQTQEKSTRWHDTATTVVDKMTGELDPYSTDRKHKLESPSFRNEGEHRPLQSGDSQGNRSTQKRWVEL